MPSHIDVLTGRWALASDQNELAIKADQKYRAISPRQGFYRVYMSHNLHMLCFAAMMEGRSDLAIRTAREMVAGVPEDYAREQSALVDPYMMIVQDVQMRFGQWDEILKEPKPPAYLPITNAFWHFARGIAHAAKGQLEQADAERGAFDAAVGRVPKDATMAINSADHVLSIARRFLDGELAFRRGQIDQSVTELRAAVKLEDDLRYMEPPEWISPVRHTLGAVLLNAGRIEEAEKVYREDLANWPENGWSLFGIAKCLKARGAAEEARVYEERFNKAWARSDLKIHASCLCIPQ
jgi:tetratricopeptide (TPR) repeat protein